MLVSPPKRVRSNVMETVSSPTEFVYGTRLCIPKEFVLPDDFTPNLSFFVEKFHKHMQSIKPVLVGHHLQKRAFLHKDLKSCSHVFLRVGTGKNSLERPYSGPHKIIIRTCGRIWKRRKRFTSSCFSRQNQTSVFSSWGYFKFYIYQFES